MSIQDTLEFVRSKGVTNSKKRNYPKRKKYQSVKDYLFMINKGCCTYCGDKFRIEDICLIKKNHHWDGIVEPKNNKVVSCKSCSSKKSKMNHKEFKLWLREERMILRKDIVENYPEYASQVFGKYHHKCIYCEFEFGHTPKNRKLTIDHKKPLIKMGDNDEQNLASSCLSHNQEKGSMKPTEYFNMLEYQGRKHNKYQKMYI